jgi:hypothetical protein
MRDDITITMAAEEHSWWCQRSSQKKNGLLTPLLKEAESNKKARREDKLTFFLTYIDVGKENTDVLLATGAGVKETQLWYHGWFLIQQLVLVGLKSKPQQKTGTTTKVKHLYNSGWKHSTRKRVVHKRESLASTSHLWYTNKEVN